MTVTNSYKSQAEISAATEIHAALIPLSSKAEEADFSMLGYLLRLAIEEAEKIIGEKQHSFTRTTDLGGS